MTIDENTAPDEQAELDLGTEGEPTVGQDDEVSSDEYEPSYTYKVKDEEREFDERLRPFIQDKESEDYLRDLYTKADGLDSYKNKVRTYEESLQDSTHQINELSSGYKALRGLRDQGNYRELFKSLGIEDKSVLEWAYEMAKEEELPEHEREYIKQNRDYQDRLSRLESELTHYKQTASSTAIESDLKELDSYVGANNALEMRMKEAGFSLRDEILSYGITTTKLTGKEPSIAEATHAVIDRYNKVFQPVSEQEVVQQTVNNRPKTLPKINGSNQSAPEERMTLDKLRKMSNGIRF